MLDITTVLLVDDSEADRYIARGRLTQKWGHEFLEHWYTEELRAAQIL